ncbi:DUF2254 family protein [Naasia sp. SYSU D00948]|uniref:DUF2254 family protein n=1 Tax=Naasia sp. SYSU D00948 TaxID=2817379 RepID=UPI001B302584|nr:DUF2254 family protein [Naasia sp. SYSU D00948]
MSTTRSLQEEALNDPLRSLSGLHEAGRLRRGVAEFLRLPLLIIAGFCVLAAGVALLDAFVGDDAPLRRLAQQVVPGKGAVDFVSAVATSLLTVTSITFSVLLLAVQQTSSSLTTVVFDQFLRRTTNQLYFGFFVGVTAFAFIILGTARGGRPPAYGPALTLILTILALVALLMLIHSSIDQMRPQSVVRSIHELALRARERALVLLGKTRSERGTPLDTPAREVRVRDSGYVVTIGEDALARVARSVGRDAEVVIDGRLGEYMVFDDVIARVVGADPDDESWDEDVLRAFGLDDIRDVDVESGYAIDQLENIAWATATSASQSPHTATTAIRALHDLAGRWLMAGERDRAHLSKDQHELPIVYVDGAVERICEALATLLIASSESRQAQTCATVLRAFTGIAPRLETEEDRQVFGRALDSALPSIIQHAELPRLQDALAALENVLVRERYDGARVREVRALLTEATRQLLPKPSDEPEAAHPR